MRRFAVKGQTLDNTSSAFIGCGICISVCPAETLSFDQTFGGARPLPDAAGTGGRAG